MVMKLMTKVERANVDSVDIPGLRAFSQKTVLVEVEGCVKLFYGADVRSKS